MGKADKLIEAARAGRKLRFSEFQTLLSRCGFVLDRVAGSHHIYWHPKAKRPLSIHPRGGEAKDYQVRQFIDMLGEFDVEPDR